MGKKREKARGLVSCHERGWLSDNDPYLGPGILRCEVLVRIGLLSGMDAFKTGH